MTRGGCHDGHRERPPHHYRHTPLVWSYPRPRDPLRSGIHDEGDESEDDLSHHDQAAVDNVLRLRHCLLLS